MDRAVLALALVACGARTDLGGARPDASVVADASSKDVVEEDVAPSKCPPLDYVNDDESSIVFASDDVAIYFVRDPCALVRTTKDGASTSTWSMGDCAGDIAVDDLDVYWTSGAGHLMRHLKDGPSGTDDLGCASLGGCPGNVHVRAVAKDVVVLVDGFRPVAMSKTAGVPYALVPTGFAPPAPVHYVFVDDTRAYWNTDIRVFSAPLDASALPFEYATSSLGLAINSVDVFWTRYWADQLELDSMPKGGGAFASLSSSGTSTPLVANDTSIYGVAQEGITIQSVSGSLPSLIVPNVHPLTLALDASCIYFGEKTATGRRITRAPN